MKTTTIVSRVILGFIYLVFGLDYFFHFIPYQPNHTGKVAAFKAGLLITLVTSTIYVITWLICYYFFIPDFMEKYTSYMLQKAAAEGVSQAELANQSAQMQQYSDMYKNPLFVVLLTYLEIFPVGLIVSLITALILRRKNSRRQEDFRPAKA